MASSLEDLLAEDGFKRRKSLTRSRTSFREESPTVPPFPFPDRLKKEFMPRDRMITGRSRSDVSHNATWDHNGTSTRPRHSHFTREKTKMDSLRPKQDVTREKHETGKTCESVEVEEEANEVHSLDSGRERQSSNSVLERDMLTKDTRNDSVLVGRRSYSENKGSSNGKPFENRNTGQAVSEPAVDKVAIQAMVSILTGHIKRFLRDKEFRTTIRENCLSSLSVPDGKENAEIKILAKLEEAIRAIENRIEEPNSTRDLKKAVLQLSVIVGLNSNELRDGFTSGIPNHRLSACAHLYLSVVYKLQRKDSSAAKRLLQVFCDSPFLARTKLLPELWDRLFLPNLSHLSAWYNREADSLSDTPRKLELLTKVYDEIMDSGTFQFAVYYKDWLTEGAETVPVPSIHVPSGSVCKAENGIGSRGLSSEMSSSPREPFSPQLRPVVSETFYNAGSESSDDCVRASDGDALVSNVKEKDEAFFSENCGRVEEKWTFSGEDHYVNGNFVESETCEEKSENTDMINAQQPETKENEVIIKRQAKSHFDLQPPESEPTEGRPSSAELLGLYLEERSPSFSTIPQDFICPLTGQLFDDPVTLETGQTFERKAVEVWFDQGNTTCPATAKTLEHKQLVPFTNLVLKRVIETWKSQNFSARALDHGRIMKNTKNFMSVGGLELLLQRVRSGNLEERTRVVSLLVCCIREDFGCRNQIAKEIDRKCLIELLFSKQVKARESAVLLLVELICLKRKNEVMEMLSGLQSEEEGIEKTMHVVLVYLQTSPPPQRPLVALLLLHFDLLAEPRKYSIYREEAIDAITEALYGGLNNDKIRESCCRALLILGGRFSSSGKLLTHSWILNQAGFKANAIVTSTGNKQEEEGDAVVDEAYSSDDEEHNNEAWQRNLCASILGNGKRSFLQAISKCLGSKNMDLVTACLTTVAWLSAALASMPDTELQLRAFSILISRLNECLENDQCVKHKVLASTSLLNFSKISECRVLLMSMAEHITFPLRNLVEVTWTAKKLYTIISGEAL